MRISDWSSDVCSSDLAPQHMARARTGERRPRTRLRRAAHPARAQPQSARMGTDRDRDAPRRRGRRAQRSEEYTSELQSLMRISYAVFCLKKKKKTKSTKHTK